MKFMLGSLLLLPGLICVGAQAAEPIKDGVAVQELVVTGRKLTVRRLIDRTVYGVGQNLQATSGSAADILGDIPSVGVDADGNVSLRGDPTVTVLIDGKPSAQLSGRAQGASLQQFSAGDIDRVEVFTTPPAQFKADGSGGVINIVTRKTSKAGLSGSGQLSLGDKRRYVAALNGAYGAGKLKLTGGLGLRQDVRERQIITRRVTIASNTATPSQEDLNERIRRLIPNAKGGLDYAFNNNQSVSASFSVRQRQGERSFDQRNALLFSPGAPRLVTDRHSDGHEWSADSGETLKFEQKLSRPGETLSLSVQHSLSKERERFAYLNTTRLPPGPSSLDHLRIGFDLAKTEASLDYDLPMGSERALKFGLDFESDRNGFDNRGDVVDPATGLSVNNPAITNHFRYRRQVNAAYGQYQAPFGSWRVLAGLRVETSQVSTYQAATSQTFDGGVDAAAYPSLHVERDLGAETKLSAGLSRRLTRADPEGLNPLVDRQDTHNLRAGDANLAPQDTWTYELGYRSAWNALTYGATAYYRLDRNSFTTAARALNADVVLTTRANLPKTKSAGLEFNLSGKAGAVLSYGISGDLFQAEVDAGGLANSGLKSTTGLNLKANLDYRPTRVDTAQISFSRQDKRLTPQGYNSAINLVNLGYKRQIRPDLAFVATVSDLFDGQHNRRIVRTSQLNDLFDRHQFGQIAYLGLIYTFGAQKRGKAGSFDYDVPAAAQ